MVLRRIIDNDLRKEVKHNQGLTTMADKFMASREVEEIKGVQIDLWQPEARSQELN
jgi:hypothetical protein